MANMSAEIPTGMAPDRPTICMYHNDPDGCCAAAVVRRAFGPKHSYLAMEIGDSVPWRQIESAEQVVLVDFSLATDDMLKLRDGWRFVWVDHHKTSLARLDELMVAVPGKRTVDEAACVLTWRTFFPDQTVPQAVLYVGDRDIWRNALAETPAFCEGLYQADFGPENDPLWQALLDDDPAVTQRLIAEGGILYQARMRQIARVVRDHGFETTFEGFRTLAINDRGSGDMGEQIRRAGYQIGYCYAEVMRAGRLQTIVTLYSNQVDVSEIARKYGGGGHRGAAGFQFDRAGGPFPEGSQGG